MLEGDIKNIFMTNRQSMSPTQQSVDQVSQIAQLVSERQIVMSQQSPRPRRGNFSTTVNNIITTRGEKQVLPHGFLDTFQNTAALLSKNPREQGENSATMMEVSKLKKFIRKNSKIV